MDNQVLNNAKYSDNTDEWFTPYEVIEEELVHYEDQFKGKVVLCNCDDPFESNFTYYFLRNFNRLRLKELICTSFSGSRVNYVKRNEQWTLPSYLNNQYENYEKRGYRLRVDHISGKMGTIVEDDAIRDAIGKNGVIMKLRGDGDFRSDECVELLKKCDICCTNPPFSLFSELFSLIMKYEKKFLLIGNQNAITYKEIFPFIKENKAWVGYKFGDMAFRVPNNTKPRQTRFWIDESGQKWRSLGNAMWLTNLDTEKHSQDLLLTQKYNPNVYPKFDDFDAINVSRVAIIPKDYDGIMGVPITFLKYHNGVQFEIIGEANHGSDNEFDLFKPRIKGKDLFKRILIKKTKHGAEKYAI